MTDIIQELRGLIAKGVPESDSGWYISNTTGSGLSIIEDGLMFPGSGICPIKCEAPQAALIVAAINHLPALLDRLEAAERGWQPIETAPRDGTQFLATTLVKRIDGRQWWEMHLIWADDETGEVHRDCEQGWSSIDDYFYWRPLPDAPAIDAALVGEG